MSQWATGHRFHSLGPHGSHFRRNSGWLLALYRLSSIIWKMKVLDLPLVSLFSTVHLKHCLSVHTNAPVPTFMKHKYKWLMLLFYLLMTLLYCHLLLNLKIILSQQPINLSHDQLQHCKKRNRVHLLYLHSLFVHWQSLFSDMIWYWVSTVVPTNEI